MPPAGIAASIERAIAASGVPSSATSFDLIEAPCYDVRYSYLLEQFSDPAPILAEIGRLVATGDFTLGKPVAEFEKRFAELIGTKHAIGVGSGTDALKLPLKALGITHGDEVITAANTFIATVGAIAETGATPVLVDCDDSFCMNVDQVEAAITPKTKAIMPVQLTGEVTDMVKLMKIARKAQSSGGRGRLPGHPVGIRGQTLRHLRHRRRLLAASAEEPQRLGRCRRGRHQ